MNKTIAIIGPESTGKSQLAASLATKWSAQWLPEYARTYLEALDRPYEYQDLTIMAQVQFAQEKDLTSSFEKVILDTNLEVFKIWSEYKYNACDPWILEQLASTRYDAYLLTDIDLPWTDDPLREHPDSADRLRLFHMYKDIVVHSGFPFTIIQGHGSERTNKAITFLQNIELW